jgi:hypothetical protein
MLTLVILLGITTLVLFNSQNWLFDTLDLIEIPSEAQWYITIVVLLNFLLSWAAEVWIFKRIAKWIDKGWWSVKSSSAEESVLLGHHGASASKRLKWRQKGKLFKLIQDDLNRLSIPS